MRELHRILLLNDNYNDAVICNQAADVMYEFVLWLENVKVG